MARIWVYLYVRRVDGALGANEREGGSSRLRKRASWPWNEIQSVKYRQDIPDTSGARAISPGPRLYSFRDIILTCLAGILVVIVCTNMSVWPVIRSSFGLIASKSWCVSCLVKISELIANEKNEAAVFIRSFPNYGLFVLYGTYNISIWKGAAGRLSDAFSLIHSRLIFWALIAINPCHIVYDSALI